MSRLFSYTIAVDDGAAPNPFFGMCTLAICKPAIRRVAGVGDWIVGLGSSKAPSGNLSGCVVYAMCVQNVLTLKEYDLRALSEWPHRIPNMQSASLQDRLGDCIYDYADGEPVQRKGVHGNGNIETDLSGKMVLISKDFYYFGARAIKLPDDLKGICHQTQGHKSNANERHYYPFVEWIRSLKLESGQLYGWPDHVIDWKSNGGCSICVRQDDDEYGISDC